MLAHLYYVHLPVFCLLYCMMSAYLHDVRLLVQYVCLYYAFLSVLWLLNWMMTAYLCIWCLPTCSVSRFLYLQVISSYPDKICIPVWFLPPCIMSSYLYSIISAHRMMSANLHDACSPVLCPLTCILSSVLYDVRLSAWRLPTCTVYMPILCLPICVMTAQLNDDCLPIWCLPTCSMSRFLYLQVISSYPDKICIPVWFLPPCIMSGYFTNVDWLPVVCRATCMTSAYH
jgi:hypothetical protein